jgi:hypothetical protein
VDEVHEVRFWDKVRSRSSQKNFGLLVQSVEHAGSVALVQRLQAAACLRRRVKARRPGAPSAVAALIRRQRILAFR